MDWYGEKNNFIWQGATIATKTCDSTGMYAVENGYTETEQDSFLICRSETKLEIVLLQNQHFFSEASSHY